MRNPSSRTPVTAFDIAPFPPPKVAEAKANFDRLAAMYDGAVETLRALRASKPAAVSEANRAAAQARLDGGTMPKATPDKVASDFDRKIAAAAADLEVTRPALDEAGNVLAAEIHVHRDEWAAQLQAEADAALDAFNVALSEARDALVTLGFARGGPGWLESFNLQDARAGLGGQFSGGVVSLGDARVGVSLDTFTPAISILDVAREAARPVEPRKPRTLKVAREAS